MQFPLFKLTVVATDSEVVAEAVRSFGGLVEMTGKHHATGSDRVAEVAGRHPEMDVIVNVQGDLPFLTNEMFEELLRPYIRGEKPGMTTLAAPFEGERVISNPNFVKVGCDGNQRAVFFTRSYPNDSNIEGGITVLHHLGLYAFRRDVLIRFAQLPRTESERSESLEQLRLLEDGEPIIVGRTSSLGLEINTPEDWARAENLIRKDPTYG